MAACQIVGSIFFFKQSRAKMVQIRFYTSHDTLLCLEDQETWRNGMATFIAIATPCPKHLSEITRHLILPRQQAAPPLLLVMFTDCVVCVSRPEMLTTVRSRGSGSLSMMFGPALDQYGDQGKKGSVVHDVPTRPSPSERQASERARIAPPPALRMESEMCPSHRPIRTGIIGSRIKPAPTIPSSLRRPRKKL